MEVEPIPWLLRSLREPLGSLMRSQGALVMGPEGAGVMINVWSTLHGLYKTSFRKPSISGHATLQPHVGNRQRAVVQSDRWWWGGGGAE